MYIHVHVHVHAVELALLNKIKTLAGTQESCKCDNSYNMHAHG